MLINQTVNNDPLSAVFAALADPTRRSILMRLRDKSATVKELAAPYDMSLPAVSKHLKVLEQAGLISKSAHAQSRECRLEAARLKEINQWLDDYRRTWQANLENLDTYLQQVQAKNKE